MLTFSAMSRQLTWGLTLATLLYSASCQARSLSRSQRQTVTSELATGLTGTGTSFNSLYGDPYSTQQQQNVLNQPYDEFGTGANYAGLGRPGLGGKYAGGSYDPIDNYNAIGGVGIGGVGGVGIGTNGYGYGGSKSGYGGGYGGGYGSGYGGGYGGNYGGNYGAGTGANWGGFGLGRGYGRGGGAAGRYPATGGVKY